MNCLTARQTLDLARPGETTVAKFDDAAQHVDACPECQIAVQQHEQFDRKVGEMVRDLVVPDGLKDRLLACVDTTEKCGVSAPTVPPDHPAIVQSSSTKNRHPSTTSRRRWLGSISVVAAGVLAALGAWSLWPRPQALGLEGVIDLVTAANPAQLPEFVRFGNGPSVKLPRTMDIRRMSLPPRQLGKLDVAVYFFTLPGRGGMTLDGRLAVIPKRTVATDDLPAAARFLPGETTYTKTGFCITAWVEGDFVYVCCLSGNDLDQLKKRHEAA